MSVQEMINTPGYYYSLAYWLAAFIVTCTNEKRIRGTDAKALKPDGKRSWECVHMQQNLFAGFPHLSYSSNPVFAERFMREAIRWEQSQKEGSERK